MRVDESLGDLLAVEAARKRMGGGIHHVVRDARDLTEDGAEAEAGEDVAGVVLVRTSLLLFRREWDGLYGRGNDEWGKGK